MLVDEVMDQFRTITLGDTTIELTYVGLNHSDSSIVIRLPKQRILFAVDFVTMASIPGQGMIDSYPLEWESSLEQVITMDWDRVLPGHPGPGGRIETTPDVRDLLTFLRTPRRR